MTSTLRSLSFLLTTVLLATCAGSADPPNTDTTVEYGEPGEEIGQLERILVEADSVHLAEMRRFFSEDQIRMLLEFETDFRLADTIDDVEAVFDSATTLGSKVFVLPDSVDVYEFVEYYEYFQAADIGLTGLAESCVAECTEPAFAPRLDQFLALAKDTDDPLDDAFFELMSEYWTSVNLFFGGLEGYPAFFNPTWDYGGHSLLGEGRHLRLLGMIDDFSSRTDRFGYYAWSMRDRLMADMVGYMTCFGLPAEAAIAELEDVKATLTLPDEEMALVDARLSALRSGDGVETNCYDGGPCSCDSG